MTFLRVVLAEFTKMFPGDARLSLSVQAVAATAAFLICGLAVGPMRGGTLLLLDCLSVLAASLRAAARGNKR
jgi:hypothetical protein